MLPRPKIKRTIRDSFSDWFECLKSSISSDSILAKWTKINEVRLSPIFSNQTIYLIRMMKFMVGAVSIVVRSFGLIWIMKYRIYFHSSCLALLSHQHSWPQELSRVFTLNSLLCEMFSLLRSMKYKEGWSVLKKLKKKTNKQRVVQHTKKKKTKIKKPKQGFKLHDQGIGIP